jgi:hypothetical protein
MFYIGINGLLHVLDKPGVEDEEQSGLTGWHLR